VGKEVIRGFHDRLSGGRLGRDGGIGRGGVLWGGRLGREGGREGERDRERKSTCKLSAPEFDGDALDAG
jgi:hypothetical protein